jgi:glycosyltransferase involved in cell wall biosynthesis
MMQLISFFKSQGYQITFSSPALDSDFMVDLNDYQVGKKGITLNCSSFDLFIKELNPDIVLFDRFMIEEQFGWRVAENCPNALRILDTEDLHCLRLARQKAFKENRIFITSDLLTEDSAKREIASILRCDLSLIISEYELELLETVFKIDQSLLYYLPIIANDIDANYLKELPPFEERQNFIFVGNFLHEPNWNAVQYLKESIWPLIKKQLPEVDLSIYGAYPSQKVLQLHKPSEGFYIKGRALNAQKVVQMARVVLAPLRFGAGIKGKLLEAMQCGTPSVTTTVGGESMYGNLPWNGCITDDEVDFANQAVKLYLDKTVWLKAQENGIQIINNRYSIAIFQNDFARQIDFMLFNIKEHRSNNFIGELLQHHTLKSTKYMARWIEEKNKK